MRKNAKLTVFKTWTQIWDLKAAYCRLKERKKLFLEKKVKYMSILVGLEPDPVLNVRIRIQPRRSGSDRIRIHNTAFKLQKF
jgi:hypothetical protein